MSSLILVTAAIIERDGKYLITQRLANAKSLPNLLEFPGGKVNENESPENCLEREILEELVIKIKVKNLFGREDYIYENGPHIDLIGFYCDYISGKIQHIGIQNHHWMSPHEMRNYNFCPADLVFIKKLNELS